MGMQAAPQGLLDLPDDNIGSSGAATNPDAELLNDALIPVSAWWRLICSRTANDLTKKMIKKISRGDL